MAVHKGGGGGGDDSEDDDDLIIGVDENFRKHIDALKRACVLEVGLGGYISTPASILSGENPAREEDDDDDDDDEDDDEDDEQLFQSIQSKYGSIGDGDSTWFRKGAPREKKLDIVVRQAEEENEEEDDEEILRSVEQLYRGGGGGGGGETGGTKGPLAKVVSPLKDSSETKTHRSPSPQGSPGPVLDSEGEGRGGDDGSSPQRSHETGDEPAEEVGRSITSFLPGSWIDTDGDEEFDGASPAGPLEMVSIQHQDNASTQTAKSCLPGGVHVVEEALMKNRQCQRTLRNILTQIEEKQKENIQMQRQVRTLVDFEKYCDRRFAGFFTDQANPSVKLIAAKVSALQNKPTEGSDKMVSDFQTCGPPENSDVEMYKKLQQKISFTFVSKRWSNEERNELAKGVKQQVYEELVKQAMDAFSAETLDQELESLDDHMSKIGGKEFTPQEMRDAVPGINWAEVARVYVLGRTPEECRTRWMNHEDSLINKGPWTKTEDKKLLRIAQELNFCDWEKISQRLGTNRTPAESLSRYQRSLNASIMRSNWTPEEDGQLRAAVEECGENNWSAVAACLQGRNNSQCLMRWYKVLHPTKKKSGRWSVEEDKRLKWAVSVHGPKKWKQIAEHVPGRTDLQCRERWCNVLDPSIKLGEWTEEEDKDLEASVAKHGPHHWAAVANDLKIRTDNQCWRRWKILHPEDLIAFQRTVHIRRTALVGNFQGRRKERPRLGPQDFISKATDLEVFNNQATGLKLLQAKIAESRVAQSRPVEKAVRKPVEKPRGLDISARERRAARIQKRKLARAGQPPRERRLHTTTSSQKVRTDSEFAIDVYPNEPLLPDKGQDANAIELGEKEKSGKRRKRKAGPSAHPDEACKRTKRQASLSNGTVRVGHSYKPAQRLDPVAPEVTSFVDLVQSLKTYCNYSSLVAREEGWPGFQRTSHPGEREEPAELTIEADTFDTPGLEKGAKSNKSFPEEGLSMSPLSPGSPQFDVCKDSLEPGKESDSHQEVTKVGVPHVWRRARWKQSKAKDLQHTDKAEVQAKNPISVGMEHILGGTEEMAIDDQGNTNSDECGNLACHLPETGGQEVAARSGSGVSCDSHQASPCQAGDQVGQGLVSSLRPQSIGVGDKEDSCRRGVNVLPEGNRHLSEKDEEVAAATRAILSWPFFHGMQEHWAQDKTYLASKFSNKTAVKNGRKRAEDTETLHSGVVKKPRSTRPVKMRGAIRPMKS